MDTKLLSTRATTWFVLCSVVAMLYFARDFLLPVALAVFVAFALAPAVRRLERVGLPRLAATIATTVGVGALVAGLGWILAGQVNDFVVEMPEYRANVRAKAADLRSMFGDTFERANSTVRDLSEDLSNAGAAETPLATTAEPPVSVIANDGGPWGSLPDTLGSVVELGAVFALVFLLAFVILLCWDDLRDRLLALAGEHDLLTTTRAADDASARVSSYLRRQLFVNGIHGVTMGLLLWWIGVPNPLVWGLLGVALRFVPYLGPAVATLAPILVSFASSDGWEQTWLTAGALIGLELITNNVVEPRIYGACTGISPFALLVSTAFWTWIWGPIGLVLAAPLSVCLLVLGKRFSTLRFLDLLFREEPALSQPSRLHHRLIANDPYEAWEVLRDERTRSSWVDTADRVLLPALGMTGIAHAENRMDGDTRARIGALAHGLVDELDEQAPASEQLPGASDVRILCLPARDEFDAVGCRLVVSALKSRGFQPATSPENRLLSEVLEAAARGEYDAIMISSVLPTHFLHLRSSCKKLLAVESRVEILVALWGEDLSVEEVRRRLPDSNRVHVVTTLAGAIAWSEEFAMRARSLRTTDPIPSATPATSP